MGTHVKFYDWAGSPLFLFLYQLFFLFLSLDSAFLKIETRGDRRVRKNWIKCGGTCFYVFFLGPNSCFYRVGIGPNRGYNPRFKISVILVPEVYFERSSYMDQNSLPPRSEIKITKNLAVNQKPETRSVLARTYIHSICTYYPIQSIQSLFILSLFPLSSEHKLATTIVELISVSLEKTPICQQL